ncbi:MAG: SufD family Fe-S cluster assembly protein [bacterium]|nr:SufD family Fe-S cluster assembly protein [bacterium]
MKEISKKLAEPGWVFAWREERLKLAETLPKELKYGIGILGILPESEVSFEQTAEYRVDASKGLELYTWREAVTQEEIAPILEGLMKSKFFPKATNYYSGLAQALFRSGLVVYAQPNVGDDGVSKEETISLDTMVSEGSIADLIVVIAKEGARVAFTSAISGGGEASVFMRTIIVLTERDARVRVTQKETLANGTAVLISARGIVAAHSSVTWSEVLAGEISMKSETENVLIGESARGEILHGIIARGSAKYDIFSSTKHLASHTYSRIRAAGLGRDTSKTVYRGMVDMVEGIRAVEGGQEARFLVLSPKAEVDAIPSLDIASKDVQCTHKLSISHIRDTDTFYPKLRGLSDEESRRLFLEGHFAQVFSGEENEEIMKEVRKGLVDVQGGTLGIDS